MSRTIVHKTNSYQNTLSFLPIADNDIMIRQETLSDMELYRIRLLIDIIKFDIEASFENEDIEVLRKVIMDHLQIMTNEDVKAFLIKPFENNKKTLLEDQERNSATLDEIDRSIEAIQDMTDEQLRRAKNDIAQNILSVDMGLIQAGMSISLQNIIRHEIGHGLGLEHFTPFDIRWKDRNIMAPYSSQSYSQITILKEIDPFAVYGIFCLYSQYPNFTNHALH